MNTDEPVNPSADLKMREKENLPLQIYCGGIPRNSGSIQGDAAARDEDDGALCAGGGSRAVGFARGRRRGKGKEWKDLSALFIRRKG